MIAKKENNEDAPKTRMEQKFEEFKQTGELKLTSADMVSPPDEPAEGEKEDKSSIDQDTTTSVDSDNVDPLVKLGMSVGDSDKPLDITVRAEDKQNFIDSVIYNREYRASYKLFGNVSVTFRARTQRDTSNVFKALADTFRERTNVTQAEYSEEVRKLMLAVQLVEFNGKELDPIKKIDVANPMLIARLDWINDMPDGVVTALYSQLIQFEAVYWTMVQNAADQNFWNPVESA